MPADRTIDGVDISAAAARRAAPSPREAFWYYWMNDLEAVRAGRWKLHLAKDGTPVDELYDLVADPGESDDRVADGPPRWTRSQAIADAGPSARSATPASASAAPTCARSAGSPTRSR